MSGLEKMLLEQVQVSKQALEKGQETISESKK